MPIYNLLLLPGDGIGPEVMAEVKKVIAWMNAHHMGTFNTEEGLCGGCAYDVHGVAVTDETVAKAKAADAVIFGSVGGPKWDKLPYEHRPEAGLLRLRKDLEHVIADAGVMQLVRNPKHFDVIVTDNLFGDMLSDVAAMLTGSLGMLASASLGVVDPKSKKRRALYEPVHGSAPDIAAKGVANPIAMIASFAMALRYSFGMMKEAAMIEQAIAAALDKGLRTADIASPGMQTVGTAQMGDAVIAEMEKLAA